MGTLIKNGRILADNKVIIKHSVIIEDGIIKGVIPNEKVIGNYKIIDANNNYVSAGFIDIHIHGAGNYGFEYEDKYAFEALCKFLINKGVTTFLPTLYCNEEYIKNLVNNINAFPELRSRIPGIYIEGPFVNFDKRGALDTKYLRKPDIDYLKHIIDISDGMLKMMTLAPELEGIDAIVDLLLQSDITPSFGHSTASLEDAISVKGVKNITHLFNAMSGISHKNPGLATLPFIDKNIFTELNGDGIHVDNSVLDMCFKTLNLDKLILITDAVISAGLEYGEYIYDTDKKIISGDEGVRYLTSNTLIGSNRLITDVLRNIKNVTGLSVEEIINTATLNPATLLGVDNKRGKIQVGYDSDIVIFDDNFNVKKVILGK